MPASGLSVNQYDFWGSSQALPGVGSIPAKGPYS